MGGGRVLKPGIGQNVFPDRHIFDDIIDFASRTKDKAILERHSFIKNESIKSGWKELWWAADVHICP